MNLDEVPTHEPIPQPATEPATEPTKHKRFKLQLQQQFMNEITDNEKDINDKIILDYFKYQNPSFLAKALIRAMEAKNWKFVSYDNGRLVN